jgi:hypothetical protein
MSALAVAPSARDSPQKAEAAGLHRGAIDLAIGEHGERPIILAADGRQLNRHSAARIAHRTHQIADTLPEQRDAH